MNASLPQNSSPEEPRAALPEGVALPPESLRDTTAAGQRPEGVLDGGGKFSFASGSRPLEGYTLKRGVGRGGFGEVYFATSDAGKEVALKCIRRNLEIELRGVSQCLNLKHPNLVSLFDIRQDEQENFWVVMEYVAGESLDQIIAAHPNGMPSEQLVGCLRQIGAGVAYLHDRGIVHRDLKPGNIFLDEGTFKIGDYGLSKFISHSRRSGQTESIGTVHYMAPEIANGRYGKEIDIYALGIIFYEMLTGHVPYDGESLGEVLMKHLTAEPDLSGIAQPYRAIVARLLHKNPEARYTSVQAMLADLDAGLAGQPLSAAPAVPATPAPAAARYAAASPAPTIGAAPGSQPKASYAHKPARLMTSSSDAVAQGVCGGFARYFGIDPLWIRLAVFLVAFFTGFIAVGAIYLLLAWLMPSDEEEVPVADYTPEPVDSTPIDMVPFFKALGRFVLAIVLGVSVGLLVGGVCELLFSGNIRYDAGVMAGVSSGFLAAASIGWLWLRTTTSSIPRVVLSLLLGAGVGVAMALAAFFSGAREELAGLLGTGVGFLTAGVAICLSLSFARVMWRVLPPLFFGLAAGLLTGSAGSIVSSPSSNIPAVFGFGAGLLVCATTAWLLFFGPLSIAGPAKRGDAAPGEADEVSPGIPSAIKILIGLAVVLAAAPVAMHLLFRTVVVNTTRPDWSTPTTRAAASLIRPCEELGCRSEARSAVSLETFAGGLMFQNKNYCDVHARQAIWQANEVGRKYAAFDLLTGNARSDLNPSVTVQKE